jgi:DNA end-binding protein Ku
MPRSNWKGHISFGLVSIPIILYNIENKKADISFHQIDKRNNARIKFQRINVDTGKTVPWENITRGYEYDKDTIIPVPDEVLEKVAGESARTIDIQTFINKNEFDSLSIDKNYYILPDEKGKGNKGYVILRESLKETNKVGIARVIISTKEYIAAITPHDNIIILSLLKYDEEIRKPSEFSLPDKALNFYKITQKEIDIAKQLIKSMSSKWNPKKYVNKYQESIHQWVDETIHKLPHAKIKSKKQPSSNVINFVDLLKKSLIEKNKTLSSKKIKKIKNK